jgi:hypothetical protein
VANGLTCSCYFIKTVKKQPYPCTIYVNLGQVKAIADWLFSINKSVFFTKDTNAQHAKGAAIENLKSAR